MEKMFDDFSNVAQPTYVAIGKRKTEFISRKDIRKTSPGVVIRNCFFSPIQCRRYGRVNVRGHI